MPCVQGVVEPSGVAAVRYAWEGKSEMNPNTSIEIHEVLSHFVDVRAGSTQDVIEALAKAGYYIVTADQAQHGDRTYYDRTYYSKSDD